MTSRILRPALPAALALAAVAPLHAQRAPSGPAAAAVQRAVETITAADFLQRLGVIADDSMRGRATPSPELDQTANFIAASFAGLGLRPAGDNETFLQRYPVRLTQVDTGGFVTAAGRGASGRWEIGSEVALQGGTVPESTVTGPVVLLIGLPADTARPFGDVDLRGAVVFQALSLRAPLPQDRLLATVARGAAAGARAWVLLQALPERLMPRIARSGMLPQVRVPGMGELSPVPLLLMRDTGAAEVFRSAGVELAALRDTSLHTVRALSGFTAAVSVRRRLLAETSAPNVVGIIEGSDPRLRDEYLIVTGHMDHVGVAGGGQGCTAIGADSICNGADDDGSGTIGVVELARAFAALTPRPRRSIVFATVSGEERGLWGSAWYARHPARPLAQHVANLNLDMISRNWRDSIAVLGKAMSTLGEVADRVTQQHPELGMKLVNDPEHDSYFAASDHYTFATHGVPVLFFFSGTHPELHQPGDDLSRVDADKAARVLKMAFYVALDVANADARPVWDATARRRLEQEGGAGP